MKKSAAAVCAVMLFSCAVMALVDGVIQPGYAAKSLVKACLFLALPLLCARFFPGIRFRDLFRFRKKGFFAALGLGIGLYGLILGAYFLVRYFFDFSAIAGNLSQTAGVTKDNFLFVALYISFANSLLEEFFFRGFGFMVLKEASTRRFAYLFSGVVFSLYHTAMMIGWFSPLLFLLVLTGLAVGGMIFSFLNEKLGCIYPSWLVHMFANFAINTIGFLLLA